MEFIFGVIIGVVAKEIIVKAYHVATAKINKTLDSKK